MYELIFDEEAIQVLEKLEEQHKIRILNKILETKQDPFRFFLRLKGRPEYKLRVGDYRVIADIQNNDPRILILYIGHRRNIYKRI
ncbi:MAG: type II toxin-antitoxin system RelE/ParE family toxin [archaeon]